MTGTLEPCNVMLRAVRFGAAECQLHPDWSNGIRHHNGFSLDYRVSKQCFKTVFQTVFQNSVSNSNVHTNLITKVSMDITNLGYKSDRVDGARHSKTILVEPVLNCRLHS